MIKLDDKKTLIVSLLCSIVLLLGGLYYMLSQWSYYEAGHGILAIIYVFACCVAFFAMRFVNIAQISTVLVLLFLILFYADQKFEWRRVYTENANSGNPFLLEAYIDEYPTLEENDFGWIWGEKAWVQFADECVEPALAGRKTGIYCKSAVLIKEHYNINPRSLVNEQFSKMKMTAQRIEAGKMQSKRQYQRCLENKICAVIPLLPADVDPKKIDTQGTDYLLTRKMFWSLVNDDQISPEVCHYMELCRALRDLNIMPIERPAKNVVNEMN